MVTSIVAMAGAGVFADSSTSGGSWSAYGPSCGNVVIICPHSGQVQTPPQIQVLGSLDGSSPTVIRATSDLTMWPKYQTFFAWIIGTHQVSVPTPLGCPLLVGGSVAMVGGYIDPTPMLCYFEAVIPPLGTSVALPVTFYIQMFYDHTLSVPDSSTHGVRVTIMP